MAGGPGCPPTRRLPSHGPAQKSPQEPCQRQELYRLSQGLRPSRPAGTGAALAYRFSCGRSLHAGGLPHLWEALRYRVYADALVGALLSAGGILGDLYPRQYDQGGLSQTCIASAESALG